MASSDLSRINTNIGALNALNALNNINTRMSLHALRLATGKKINSSADDAAGFTIASKLRVKSEGLGTALDNIGSAKNVMTVAEGHLTNVLEILTKMKSKAQQAANGTLGADERAAIMEELQGFNNQVDAEVDQAKWAGVDILGTSKTFQIGVGTSNSDELSVDIAQSVWSGGATTFDSTGLDVVASSSATRTIATTAAVATVNAGLDAVPFGTSSTINTLISELGNGHYTLEVTTTGAGSVGAATVTVQLRNSNGNLVTIDADGTTGGAVGASLSTTIAVGSGDPGTLNLGVGITVDLDNIATANGTVGTVVAHVDYARGGSSVDDMSSAQDFMDKIDSAISKVNEGLSYIGSMINRMSYQEQSLTVAKTNTESAYSRIMDADMAWEQLEATKLMILQQTATAMLAQANVAPQTVLALFK